MTAQAAERSDRLNAGQALRILAYARSYWIALIGLALLMLISAGVAALQPWAMKILIDNVLGGARPSFAPLLDALGLGASRNSLLIIAVTLGLALFAINSAIDAISSWGWTIVGRGMTYKLAQDLFARLQRRSLSYHSRVGVGETMMRVGDDCWSIQKLLDLLIFNPANSLLTLAFVVWLMLQLDPTLTAALLVIAPLVLVASTLAGRALRANSERGRAIGGDMRAHVQRTLAGIAVVQSYGQEGREQARFVDLAQAGIRTQQRQAVLGALNGLLPGLLTTLGAAFVLWACAYQVINDRITLGGMLVSMAYYGTLRSQIAELAKIYPGLQGLRPTVSRVDEVLTVDPEVSDRPGAVTLPPVSGRIRFEQVGFGYEQGRPTLKDICLEVAPGEKVALVGPTGAGKSTLVSLIPRFFDPDQGRVLIDGYDLQGVQLASLRSQIALVLQEPFLFPISLAENIAYGRPEASREEIEAAAKAANAHDFIMRLPEGYDTVVGERGATLSGGERQRISIARALLKDAPILILDEPTSALDAGTEALIMEALGRLMRERTTFIIAHRLATVQHADRIIVLDQGSILETGTHQELISTSGLYARFCALQFHTQAKSA